MESVNTYRYPGPKAFEAGQHELFFGRKAEIEFLSNLINLKKIVVLFGKSGIGKSSLLNAGVIPQLREKENYQVGAIRLLYKGDQLSPKSENSNYLVNTTIQAFPGETQEGEEDFQKIPFPSENLWWFFKKKQLKDENRKLYLLIFDQFEELGTYQKEVVADFINELNELLNVSIIPEFKSVLHQEVGKNSTLLTKEQINLLYEPIPVKVVFIIKSEKIGLLHSVKSYITDILQNCYELNPLSRDQAREAIKEPASSNKIETLAPAFTYEPGAIEAILDFLIEKTDSTFYESPGIQTALLQMICSQIEQVMVPGLSGEKRVTLKALKEKVIESLAEDYYDRRIKMVVEKLQLDQVRESLLREFIEKGLISEQGFREQVFMDRFPIAYEPLKENDFTVLQLLVEYGILRRDVKVDGNHSRVFFEVSHEKLILPINRARAKRLENLELEKNRGTEIKGAEKITANKTEGATPGAYSGKASGAVKDAQFYFLEGSMFSRAGKYGDAIDQYSHALKLEESAKTHYERGLAFYELGKIEDAINDFNQTILLDKSYYEAYNELGRCYLKQENFEEAQKYFKLLVNHLPNADYGFNNLGLTLFRMARKAEKDNKGKDAVKLYNESVKYQDEAIRINPNYSSSYLNRGIALGLLKRFDEAILDFDFLEKLEPNTHTPYYSRGLCYFEMGGAKDTSADVSTKNYQKAVIELSQSLIINPGDIQALYYRALTYEKLKDYSKGIQDYSEILRLIDQNDPMYRDTYYGKGVCNSNLGNDEAAIADFSRILEIDKDYINAYFERGRVYFKKKEFEKAVIEYNEVIRRRPDYVEAHYNLGLCYSNMGGEWDDRAIASFSEALNFDPGYTNASFERGFLYYKLRKYDEAAKDYSAVVAKEPEYYQAWYNLGLAHADSDHSEQAIEEFNRAIAINPDYVNAYFEKGTALYYLKKYKESGESYSEVVKRKPDYYQAWYNLGLCKVGLGLHNEGIDHFSSAIKLNPEYTKAYFERAFTLYDQKKYEESARDYAEVIKREPNYIQAWHNSGLCYSSMGQNETAILHFSKALEVDPKYVKSLYERGLCEYRLKQYKEAIVDLAELVKIEPTYQDSHLTMGVCYYELGNYDKALEETNLEIKYYPDSAIALTNRADIYRKLKEPEKAWKDVTRSLEIDPEDGYSYSARALLRADMGDEKAFFADLLLACKKKYPLHLYVDEEPVFLKYKNDTRFKEYLDLSKQLAPS